MMVLPSEGQQPSPSDSDNNNNNNKHHRRRTLVVPNLPDDDDGDGGGGDDDSVTTTWRHRKRAKKQQHSDPPPTSPPLSSSPLLPPLRPPPVTTTSSSTTAVNNNNSIVVVDDAPSLSSSSSIQQRCTEPIYMNRQLSHRLGALLREIDAILKRDECFTRYRELVYPKDKEDEKKHHHHRGGGGGGGCAAALYLSVSNVSLLKHIWENKYLQHLLRCDDGGGGNNNNKKMTHADYVQHALCVLGIIGKHVVFASIEDNTRDERGRLLVPPESGVNADVVGVILLGLLGRCIPVRTRRRLLRIVINPVITAYYNTACSSSSGTSANGGGGISPSVVERALSSSSSSSSPPPPLLRPNVIKLFDWEAICACATAIAEEEEEEEEETEEEKEEKEEKEEEEKEEDQYFPALKLQPLAFINPTTFLEHTNELKEAVQNASDADDDHDDVILRIAHKEREEQKTSSSSSLFPVMPDLVRALHYALAAHSVESQRYLTVDQALQVSERDHHVQDMRRTTTTATATATTTTNSTKPSPPPLGWVILVNDLVVKSLRGDHQICDHNNNNNDDEYPCSWTRDWFLDAPVVTTSIDGETTYGQYTMDPLTRLVKLPKRGWLDYIRFAILEEHLRDTRRRHTLKMKMADTGPMVIMNDDITKHCNDLKAARLYPLERLIATVTPGHSVSSHTYFSQYARQPDSQTYMAMSHLLVRIDSGKVLKPTIFTTLIQGEEEEEAGEEKQDDDDDDDIIILSQKRIELVIFRGLMALAIAEARDKTAFIMLWLAICHMHDDDMMLETCHHLIQARYMASDEEAWCRALLDFRPSPPRWPQHIDVRVFAMEHEHEHEPPPPSPASSSAVQQLERREVDIQKDIHTLYNAISCYSGLDDRVPRMGNTTTTTDNGGGGGGEDCRRLSDYVGGEYNMRRVDIIVGVADDDNDILYPWRCSVTDPTTKELLVPVALPEGQNDDDDDDDTWHEPTTTTTPSPSSSSSAPVVDPTALPELQHLLRNQSVVCSLTRIVYRSGEDDTIHHRASLLLRLGASPDRVLDRLDVPSSITTTTTTSGNSCDTATAAAAVRAIIRALHITLLRRVFAWIRRILACLQNSNKEQLLTPAWVQCIAIVVSITTIMHTLHATKVHGVKQWIRSGGSDNANNNNNNTQCRLNWKWFLPVIADADDGWRQTLRWIREESRRRRHTTATTTTPEEEEEEEEEAEDEEDEEEEELGMYAIAMGNAAGKYILYRIWAEKGVVFEEDKSTAAVNPPPPPSDLYNNNSNNNNNSVFLEVPHEFLNGSVLWQSIPLPNAARSAEEVRIARYWVPMYEMLDVTRHGQKKRVPYVPMGSVGLDLLRQKAQEQAEEKHRHKLYGSSSSGSSGNRDDDDAHHHHRNVVVLTDDAAVATTMDNVAQARLPNQGFEAMVLRPTIRLVHEVLLVGGSGHSLRGLGLSGFPDPRTADRLRGGGQEHHQRLLHATLRSMSAMTVGGGGSKGITTTTARKNYSSSASSSSPLLYKHWCEWTKTTTPLGLFDNVSVWEAYCGILNDVAAAEMEAEGEERHEEEEEEEEQEKEEEEEKGRGVASLVDLHTPMFTLCLLVGLILQRSYSHPEAYFSPPNPRALSTDRFASFINTWYYVVVCCVMPTMAEVALARSRHSHGHRVAAPYRRDNMNNLLAYTADILHTVVSLCVSSSSSSSCSCYIGVLPSQRRRHWQSTATGGGGGTTILKINMHVLTSKMIQDMFVSKNHNDDDGSNGNNNNNRDSDLAVVINVPYEPQKSRLAASSLHELNTLIEQFAKFVRDRRRPDAWVPVPGYLDVQSVTRRTRHKTMQARSTMYCLPAELAANSAFQYLREDDVLRVKQMWKAWARHRQRRQRLLLPPPPQPSSSSSKPVMTAAVALSLSSSSSSLTEDEIFPLDDDDGDSDLWCEISPQWQALVGSVATNLVSNNNDYDDSTAATTEARRIIAWLVALYLADAIMYHGTISAVGHGIGSTLVPPDNWLKALRRAFFHFVKGRMEKEKEKKNTSNHDHTLNIAVNLYDTINRSRSSDGNNKPVGEKIEFIIQQQEEKESKARREEKKTTSGGAGGEEEHVHQVVDCIVRALPPQLTESRTTTTTMMMISSVVNNNTASDTGAAWQRLFEVLQLVDDGDKIDDDDDDEWKPQDQMQTMMMDL